MSTPPRRARRVTRRSASLAAAAALFAAASLSDPPSASAAGLYFSDRGVRPIGRGGAFVAGADDLGSMWYNPAGLAFAGNSVLADASWLRFGSTFQRRSLVHDPATGNDTVQGSNYFPEVSGTSPLLPLPTLAVSNNFGAEQWNFALGVYAPYAALTSYPEEAIRFQGREVPAPQRYSLITLNGSALAVLGAYASWMPSKSIAFGFGLQAMVGTFASRIAFSACPPERLICQTEQPDYDAYGELTVGPIFAPSGTLGLIGILHDAPASEVRFGASLQLPFWVNAPAKADLRLPAAAVFRNATVQGNEARVSFKLPPIVRVGLETRLGGHKQTRLEVAAFYEAWSVHDEISIEPSGSGIFLRNVQGFPDPYQVGTMKQARGFRDTYSLHGGGEHTFNVGGYDLTFRAGLSYERSAVPRPYLSVLTVDLDKIQLAIGGSLYVSEKKNLRLDVVLAHTFGFITDVDPAEAQIGRVRVVRANEVPPQDVVKVNGGRYTAQADVIGVGLNWKY